jgi:hypothetical protein
MVNLTNVVYISSDTTVTDFNNVYLVDATKGSLTITLPLIVCDGMNYNFTREDTTSNAVTIVAEDPNTIYQNTLVSGAVLLMTSIIMQSYQDNWYTTFNTYAMNIMCNRPLFSTSFTSSEGRTFVTALGGARTPICQFNCLGSIYANITLLDTVLANTVKSPVNGTIDLRDFNTQKIYGKAEFSLDPVTEPVTGVAAYITEFNPIPEVNTVMEYGITVEGDKSVVVDVYSMTLR